MDDLRYPLGSTSMLITPIGLGCWQFSGGKGLIGGYWRPLDQERVNAIVKASLDGGVNWFDTAEAYGMGASEDALSTALDAAGVRNTALIATKWLPFFRFAGSIARTFPKREEHLAPHGVDLHQVHQPWSFSSIERQMDEMAELVDAGSIRAVGVSNFSAGQMRRAHDRLARRGIPLASNQVRYSLLDREIEENGVLETADELGVTIIAYSPLAQGVLTGKYHESEDARRSLSGPRRFLPRFKSSGLEKSLPLVRKLQEVAEAHDASAAQVALAWTVQRHGERVVAIPGASSVSQAESNAASMSLRLTEDQLGEIDVQSRRLAGR
ncbi:MAG: aldo/keto reductase [Spirochaetota bacterium]